MGGGAVAAPTAVAAPAVGGGGVLAGGGKLKLPLHWNRPNPPHREPNRYPLPSPTTNPHTYPIFNKTAGMESFSTI